MAVEAVADTAPSEHARSSKLWFFKKHCFDLPFGARQTRRRQSFPGYGLSDANARCIEQAGKRAGLDPH